MNDLIRSILWETEGEKAPAAANLKEVRADRFLLPLPVETRLLEEIQRVFAAHGLPPSLKRIIDWAESGALAEETSYLYDLMNAAFYTGGDFLSSMEQIIEAQGVDHLLGVSRKALEIARDGITTKAGTVKGVHAAVNHLISEVKTPPGKETRAPSNLREAKPYLVRLYENRKSNPNKVFGVLTGYGLIDGATAGVRKKNLFLLAGFGGHLKSTLMLNMMLNSCMAGWNSLLFTSEMAADDVKLMIVAIHSGNPQFNKVAC